jgi:hypothetical protein
MIALRQQSHFALGSVGYDRKMPLEYSFTPTARDSVAVAVEKHLRNMEAAGHGKFTISQEGNEIDLAFGRIKVRGETYDVALLRLASALLDSVDFCFLFLARMRNHAC